jgi:hypothetical protein
VRNWHGDALRSPDRNITCFDDVAVAPNGYLRGAFVCALVLDAICDRLRLTDNTEARRRDQGDAAVAFVRMTGDEGVHGRGKTQCASISRHIMHAAIGDHDDAGKTIGRDIGQRRVKRGEQTRAVGLAVGFSGLDNAHLQSRNSMQRVEDLRAGRLGLRHAIAEVLARALVDNDDRN